MVNTEILEGLKAGLERGQSLKRAMISFFNAGYSKQEIEEAARALSQTPIKEAIPSQPEIKSQKQKQVQPQLSVPKQPVPSQKPITPVSTQNVSSYGVSGYETKQKSDKLIVIILVSVLVFLFGILATVFFFKDEIMSLFGG